MLPSLVCTAFCTDCTIQREANPKELAHEVLNFRSIQAAFVQTHSHVIPIACCHFWDDNRSPVYAKWRSYSNPKLSRPRGTTCDQEMAQSQITGQPMEPCGEDTEHIHTNEIKSLIKSTSSLSLSLSLSLLHRDDCQAKKYIAKQGSHARTHAHTHTLAATMNQTNNSITALIRIAAITFVGFIYILLSKGSPWIPQTLFSSRGGFLTYITGKQSN